MDRVLEILALVVPSLVTGILGWFVGKRKEQAEAKSSEIENVEKALGIYRGIIGDLTVKLKELEIRVQELQTMLDRVEAENEQLKKQLKIQ